MTSGSELWQFNFYLGLVGDQRQMKELGVNLKSMDSKELQILDSIYHGYIDQLKMLHENEYTLRRYKDLQYKLAVKFNHIDIAEYLYISKSYNINTASFSGLMHTIAEYGSEEMFNYFFNKYEGQFHEVDLEIISERDLYKAQEYVNLTTVLQTALENNNMDVVYAMQNNHKIFDKINFDEIRRNIEEKSKFSSIFYQKEIKRVLTWLNNFK